MSSIEGTSRTFRTSTWCSVPWSSFTSTGRSPILATLRRFLSMPVTVSKHGRRLIMSASVGCTCHEHPLSITASTMPLAPAASVSSFSAAPAARRPKLSARPWSPRMAAGAAAPSFHKCRCRCLRERQR